MSEEELKAIEEVKRELTDEDRREYMSSWFAKDLDIILNLIEKQQKELELKDKVIDEMVNHIERHCFYSDAYGNSCDVIEDSCYKEIDCNECIKQYFINKVKGEK